MQASQGTGQGVPQRLETLLGLGQEDAALDCRQRRLCEGLGIGVGSQLSSRLHGRQASLEKRFPGVERPDQSLPKFVVAICHLGSQGADGASAKQTSPALPRDYELEPGLDPAPGIQAL